jgi:hypothetical protein
VKHILAYGDSLSWGIIPTTRRRPEFHERWPGVMELALNCPVLCPNGYSQMVYFASALSRKLAVKRARSVSLPLK